MSDAKIQINLRSIRKESGLSLSATEALTGVSKAMLGQIERGESSPTIATLWKLTKGFNLPLSAFITEPPTVEHQFEESISVQTVFPYDDVLKAETFIVGIPSGLTHESAAHRPGVVEDVFALDYDVELFFDNKWHKISKGNSLRFAADQPHAYRNLGPFPVHIHNTIYYPS